MARKRMVDPSIWSDDGFAELPPRQQVLYIGLFSNADDEGRLKGSAQAIRLAMPAVYGGVSIEEIEVDLVAVLAVMRQIVRYEVDGRTYLAFRNYPRWQRIDKPQPSILPAPPDMSENDQEPFGERSPNETRTVLPNRKEEKLTEVKSARARARDCLVRFGVSEGAVTRSETNFVDIPEEDWPVEAENFVSYHTLERKQPPKNKDRAWGNWLKEARRIRIEKASRRNGHSPPERPLPVYVINDFGTGELRKGVSDGF